MLPMLARPAEMSFDRAVLQFVGDPEWGMDLKMDGRRLLVELGHKPVGYNRAGQVVNLPKHLHEILRRGGPTIVIDGELMPDGSYELFDMPCGAGLSVDDPWTMRRSTIDTFLQVYEVDPEVIRSVPYAIDREDKAVLVQRVLTDGLEGLVAKRLTSRYEPGQRSSRWKKVKHTKTVDCVVTRLGIDGKANMAVAVYTPGQDGPVEIGEVSALTGDGPRVQVGDVVEVTYLYVGVNSRLVQPVKPILRHDKPAEQCSIDQLVYRKEPT